MADLNTFLTRLLYSRLPQIGGSGGSASGVLTVSTTSAGTPASTSETDLWTYALPANTLDVDGRTLRITVWFLTTANANNKRARVYFGSTVIQDTGAFAFSSAAQGIMMQGLVSRTGAATQLAPTFQLFPGTPNSAIATPTETLSGAITIKATGQNGTANANDLTFKAAIVELLN